MKFFIIIKEESQRLPNKNFLKLGDRPLYKHLLDELDGEAVFMERDPDHNHYYLNDKLAEHVK